MLAEQQHPGPRDDRVGDDEQAEVQGNCGVGVDVLQPREDEKQDGGRPQFPARRVAAGAGVRAVVEVEELFRPLVDDLPRVDQRPNVPEQSDRVSEPDPPDNPDEGRGEVLDGLVRPEERRRDDDQEELDRQRLDRGGHYLAGNRGGHHGRREQQGGREARGQGGPVAFRGEEGDSKRQGEGGVNGCRGDSRRDGQRGAGENPAGQGRSEQVEAWIARGRRAALRE